MFDIEQKQVFSAFEMEKENSWFGFRGVTCKQSRNNSAIVLGRISDGKKVTTMIVGTSSSISLSSLWSLHLI